MERQAEAIFAHVDRLGGGSMLEGTFVGIEQGWFQGEIGQAAYDLERKLNDGTHVVVGVNAFLDGNDEPVPDILQISRECEEEQAKRLAAVKADRAVDAVERSLARVRADAADSSVNLMPALLDAVRAYATVGEVMDALAQVFGRHREDPVI
jgi:methylmalonyl-CoA mutase N-terminal domain/subunit